MEHRQARRAEVEPIDSMAVALEDLRQRLRRRADDVVDTALRVQVLAAAGYRAPEIKTQLGLADDEYTTAHRWLKAASA